MNNIFNITNNFTNLDNYLGIAYAKIFNEIPQSFNIFYKNNKLTYANSIELLNYEECDNYIIDYRALLKNINKDKEKLNVEVMCYSIDNYFIIGNTSGENIKDNFIIDIALTSSLKCGDWYLEVYCEENNINNIFNKIYPYISCIENEANISFGITSVDQTNSIYTVWHDYKKIDIDIDKNYNDDFKPAYNKICNCVNSDNTSLMLFYGEPGTGKTSVIKHLIAKYPEKDFVFVDDAILVNAPQEKLVSYFTENKNVIFILEDCEKVLMRRDKCFNPIINTLLNITDGIIGDVLGIKIICTFNTELSNIDSALLRKGRLSMKYEFKKLKAEKVNKILGKEINKDMTLADIYNYEDENDYSKDQSRKIGF